MAQYLVYADSAYRNTVSYVNSNTYTLYLTNPIRNVSRVELVSAFINTAGISNNFCFLDVLELRTPFNGDACKLGAGGVPSGNTAAAGSFAMIPLDVTPGTVKFFKESGDFKIEGKYPSRIDRLDRLTVSWLDINGRSLTGLNNTTGTGFLLRCHTSNVKIEKSILNDLPPPVPLDGGPNMVLIGALLAAGLLVILFVRH